MNKVLVFNLIFLTAVIHSSFGADCESYFYNLTESVVNAFACFSKFSRPLAICSRCSENVAQSEIILNDTNTKNQFGIPCSSYLVQKQLIQPWSDIISSLRKTWLSAYCNQCLVQNSSDLYSPTSFYADNDSLPNYNLSAYNNATLKVFNRLNATVECVTRYVINSNVSFLDSVNFPSGSSIQVDNKVCLNCLANYSNLIQAYETWIREVGGHKQNMWLLPLEVNTFTYRELCVDVVSALNRSHFVFSNILKCPISRTQKTVPVLLPLIICAISGVAFHAALICFFHRPSHVVVYMQSRVEAAATDPALPTTSNGITRVGNIKKSVSSLLRKTSFAPVPRNLSFDVLTQRPSL
ncbi:hypothetical protein Aperf_G00000006698 [Anoplocephala perfoliata]